MAGWFYCKITNPVRPARSRARLMNMIDPARHVSGRADRALRVSGATLQELVTGLRVVCRVASAKAVVEVSPLRPRSRPDGTIIAHIGTHGTWERALLYGFN